MLPVPTWLQAHRCASRTHYFQSDFLKPGKALKYFPGGSYNSPIAFLLPLLGFCPTKSPLCFAPMPLG